MIFWIASYPKSGNTWLRALISTYYFSQNGSFNETLLKKIDQFPTRKYFLDFDYNPKVVGDTCKYWIKAQEKINLSNKLKFFKTHNAFGKLNSYDFTNSKNSLGCIYIVRDPRNVLTSIKNHYELNTEKAINWMKNEKQFVYDVEKVNEFGFSDFQFISSWSLNYQSWKIQKKIPIKIIRYEDLSIQTYSVFKEIIQFINKTANFNEKINIQKIKKTLNTTSFIKLKEREAKHGFSEAVTSHKNKKRKITFFNLGPENDWKKILNKDVKEKLNKIFKNELDELHYS